MVTRSWEQQQITNIINELESLSLRTSTLTCELKQLGQQNKQVNRANPTSPKNKQGTHCIPDHSENKHILKEGDRVVIRNADLGKKGTEGTVLHITKTQITLQDASGQFHARRLSNVRKVKKREP